MDKKINFEVTITPARIAASRRNGLKGGAKKLAVIPCTCGRQGDWPEHRSTCKLYQVMYKRRQRERKRAEKPSPRHPISVDKSDAGMV